MTARPELGSWQDWARQRLVFTEAVRGGPLVWPVGAEHLAGDPLGPVRHAHDDAAEYYFVLSGQCLVEVAGEERFARDEPRLVASDTAELVYLVVDGRVHTRVGLLSGALGPGDYVHVRRDVEHEFSSLAEQATVLRFDCEFLPFGGVDLGPGRGTFS